VTVYDYEVGHNIPESKGGPTVLENLRPLCSRCNKSMGSQYTIDEFNELGKKDKMCPIGCIIC
jgi:5-methylcytosine-specific restriction endonuclease McrA